MKTSIQIVADTFLAQIRPIVNDCNQRGALYNYGSITIDLRPAQEAVAFDVAELYGTFEEYWWQNREAVVEVINAALPRRWVVEDAGKRADGDTLYTYLAYK